MRAFSADFFSFSSRARSFSSRAVLAMPRSSSVWLRSAWTCSSLRRSLCVPSAKPTALPPAKISCRPCSSYHLVSVAFLCGVRDDALLGAAEVVVVEILEPHAGDEQEVPAIGAALLDVLDGTLAR